MKLNYFLLIRFNKNFAMKKLIINPIFYVNKFLHRKSIQKSESRKISVHYRRDLDALGEYIKV